MTSVVVLDSDPRSLAEMCARAARTGDVSVCGRATSLPAALTLLDEERPDVVLVDLWLRGTTGVAACREIAARPLPPPVLLMSEHLEAGPLRHGLEAGARGCVTKSCPPVSLRDALRVVADGGMYVDPETAATLIGLATARRRSGDAYGLTPQEREVVSLLPRGLMNREIGSVMGISEHTVKSHLRSATRKLGVRDRAEAAAHVVRHGIA